MVSEDETEPDIAHPAKYRGLRGAEKRFDSHDALSGGESKICHGISNTHESFMVTPTTAVPSGD